MVTLFSQKQERKERALWAHCRSGLLAWGGSHVPGCTCGLRQSFKLLPALHCDCHSSLGVFGQSLFSNPWGRAVKCFFSLFGGCVSLTSWNVVQEPVRREKRECSRTSEAQHQAAAVCFEGVGGLLCKALFNRVQGATSTTLWGKAWKPCW